VSITPADSYSAAYPRLQRAASQHAHRLLRDRGEADDVVQDALLRAYVSWDAIAGFEEAWVGRVAINLAIGRLRRKPLPVTVAERGSEISLPVDLRIDLTRAVDCLPRRQRQVVLLRYVGDLSVREVAGVLEISPGSVKRHLHRAMAALRDPSAGLTGTYSITIREENPMSDTTFDWRATFKPAIEPDGGWPPGPWDHRWFEAGDGQLQRLACDHQTGEPILDADGDEVRTGPGMDFVLVKVDRTLQAFEPVPAAVLGRLDDASRAVLDHAQRLAVAFSSYGVDAVHLAMALLDLVPEAESALGTDSAGLRRAYAEFSDGPHRDARVALVEQRLADEWSRPYSDGDVPIRMCLGLLLYITEAIRRIDHFDSLLPDEEPTLMVRPIDLLHRVTDPGERYQFVRQLITGNDS